MRREHRQGWGWPAAVAIVGLAGAVVACSSNGAGTTSPTTVAVAVEPPTTAPAAPPASGDREPADSHPSHDGGTTGTTTPAATTPADDDGAARADVAPGTFIETFDGAPDSPQPWHPADWDVTVHSRDVGTWDALEPVAAHHTSACGPPGSMGDAVHEVTAYEDAVFLCRDHVMTSLLASGYGLIYLTPDQVLDFTDGTATISFDLSTLRTAGRDWWSVWITPFDEQLQLPLESWLPDLSGPPRNGVQVRLDTSNLLRAEIYEDFANVQFPDYPTDYVTGDSLTTYEQFLSPDAARRDTFEIQISRTHLKVGMPAYDVWWIDTEIPELPFSSGVVQFGHHSYNPEKDCGTTNQAGPDGTCRPNTWHWDNIAMAPTVPFTMIHPDRRVVTPSADTITFATPAPAAAHLRFAGAADAPIEVSFDGGPWQVAEMPTTSKPFAAGIFNSYWTPVPAGTTQVAFRGTNWYGGDWRVRDATIWARPVLPLP